MNHEPVITAKRLCFDYGPDHIPLMREVSFAIGKGDFAALIGSNGAGKSTLLRLILSELEPCGGELALFGEPVRKFRDWNRLAYVPQPGQNENAGFPATALEIVCSAMYSKIGPMRPLNKAHKEAALEALALVGAKELAGRIIGKLSGGQRQRVMMARSLAAGCELLLLDEPSTGIDAEATDALYELLQRLNRDGMTIFMVTHDTARISAVVNRILCLEEGTLMELSPEELRHELRHKHVHSQLV
jgi:zinc transport system ATP-binding protein